ncbi:hypothetical protein ACFW3D_19895 [Streptomyces sp. NPDC058864]
MPLLQRALNWVTTITAELTDPVDDPCHHDPDETGACEEAECQ